MDSEYIQQIRYKLQKRLKRLNTADFNTFHWTLLQTWGFLQEHDVIQGILEDLERRFANCEQSAARIMAGEAMVGDSESENNAICYWVIKKCAQSTEVNVELQLAVRICRPDKYDEGIEWFRQNYVEPLFDYIDEQIDDKRMTLSLLKKYKHRCEWFRGAELLAKCTTDTRRGEKLLAYDLYEYLHDQGIAFHIEPESVAGRVDLISAQSGRDRLLADAKIFNPDGGQTVSYLAKGFRQIYDYAKTYNEPFGYLVIFKTCEQELCIQTPQQEQAMPFMTHNNKTIFLVVIDLFQYGASASKRGKLKAQEVTQEQFVEFVSQQGDTVSATNS